MTPIIIASILEALVSFFASVAVIVNERFVRKFVHGFISFAVGALLGVVFFDLMPEALHLLEEGQALFWVLVGFLFFFVLEKFLSWYHRHDEETEMVKSTAGHLVLIGDAVHNFIDGVIIALSFTTGWQLGVVTTLAILLHEIPQEVSDFVILLHSGVQKHRALLYNVGVSLTTIIGAIVGYTLVQIEGLLGFFVAIVAGNFLYLAAADLIPELHHKHRSTSSAMQIVLVVIGAALVYYLGAWLPE